MNDLVLDSGLGLGTDLNSGTDLNFYDSVNDGLNFYGDSVNDGLKTNGVPLREVTVFSDHINVPERNIRDF